MMSDVCLVWAEFVQATGYELPGSEETVVAIDRFHVLFPLKFVRIESKKKPPRERAINRCRLGGNLPDSPETRKPPSGGYLRNSAHSSPPDLLLFWLRGGCGFCRTLPDSSEAEAISSLFSEGVSEFLNRWSAVRLCPGPPSYLTESALVDGRGCVAFQRFVDTSLTDKESGSASSSFAIASATCFGTVLVVRQPGS